MIILTVISILAITCAAWMVNKLLPFKVCPICAGVSGTWLWMLAASLLGYRIDLVIIAMLLGGSVVGIAYQLEKRLPAGRSSLLWKALFIPAGFIAAYGLVLSWWNMLTASLAFLALVAFLFLSPHKKSQNRVVEELKEKMKNCC